MFFPSTMVCTGKYPNFFGGLDRYLLDLNLFFINLTKSDISSPVVVAKLYWCMGCVILWFFDTRPDQKQLWNIYYY